jgi:hypothetical protein
MAKKAATEEKSKIKKQKASAVAKVMADKKSGNPPGADGWKE